MPRRRDENQTLELLREMRDVHDGARSDYRVANTSRFAPRPRGVQSTGSNADWHWRTESRYFFGVERCRDWDRNHMVVGSAVDRVCDNVIGDEGPTLNPQTGDPELDQKLREKFYQWADDPLQADCRGQHDFWEQLWLALRHVVVDGDVFLMPLKNGRLQMVENHRVRTPTNTKRNVVLGVLVDDVNRPEQYWVTRQDVGCYGSVQKVSEIEPYPAFHDEGEQQGEPAVFHFKLPRRVSQTRGVSLLAPTADVTGMMDDLNFSKLVQAASASFWFVIEELAADAPAPPKLGGAGDNDVLGSRTSEIRDDGTSEVREALAPGARLRGKRGVTYKPWSPNTPNPEFFPHIKLLLSILAVNLKINVNILLCDASDTNFSGWRGAMDESRKGFRYLQSRLNSSVASPVYRWKLWHFIAEDEYLRAKHKQLGDRFFAHQWTSPAWPYIEPTKDAQGDILQLSGVLTSPRRLFARRNMLWTEVSQEYVDDLKEHFDRAMAAAKELNSKYKPEGAEKVSWREFARMALPQGMTTVINTEDPAKAAPAPAKGDTAA